MKTKLMNCWGSLRSLPIKCDKSLLRALKITYMGAAMGWYANGRGIPFVFAHQLGDIVLRYDMVDLTLCEYIHAICRR
jgi:hypothetical protein